MVFWILALSAVIFGCLLVSEKTAFIYGVFIGLVNLGLSLLFCVVYEKRVPSHSGESLGLVIKTIIIRLAVISSLLVYGFKWVELVPEPLLLGFVLGQLLFLFNHFFRVTTNNVK